MYKHGMIAHLMNHCELKPVRTPVAIFGSLGVCIKEGPYQDRPLQCPFRLSPLLTCSGSALAFLKIQGPKSKNIENKILINPEQQPDPTNTAITQSTIQSTLRASVQHTGRPTVAGMYKKCTKEESPESGI